MVRGDSGSRDDGVRNFRSRRRPRDEDDPLEFSRSAAFAVPLGSRDLSQIFSEIFESQGFDRQLVRRVREPRPTGPQTTAPMLQAPPNVYLKPGQTFSGFQHVTHWPPGKPEKWNVEVVLNHCDYKTGEVFGTMTARNVPGAEDPVVTYFEGEVIDNVNSTFYSNPDASARSCILELRNWARFPSFRPLRESVLEEDGRASGLADSPKVFMRWKEKFFISGGDCRLTIAGVYYVALDRKTGDINAFYFDPASAPDQKLMLKAGVEGVHGYSLPTFKMA